VTTTICFTAKNIYYLKGGGHFWVPLNWTLALRALGCDVVWLEPIDPKTPVEEIRKLTRLLKDRLEPYGLGDSVALCSITTEPLDPAVTEECLTIDAACELSTLLVNLRYDLPAQQVRRFRHSALLDIDPGLMQMWVSVGRYSPARHDLYFTIGETVGTPNARFPSCGVEWHYTPPPVFLPQWMPVKTAPTAPYTTVAHWWGEEIRFNGVPINTEKRESFLHYVDLPSRVAPTLELALTMGDVEDEERKFWGGYGWQVQDSHQFTATPEEYRTYVQQSRGEFSCAKPSCMQLENAWVSDRTICYLASGKPAIVQHTGPSRFLPDAEGLFRFRNIEEAAEMIAHVEADYDQQCRAARTLAETYFDAKKVVGRVLERAL
jgi:hypothetical protein